MRIVTFLPHVGVFGGVRRFLELGNAWTDAGHEVTLYNPEGLAPGWLPYRGSVAAFATASTSTSDLAVCADPHTYEAFRAHRAARHLYYCVLEKDPGLPRAIADVGVLLAANSGPLMRVVARRTGRPVIDGRGGIDPVRFSPDPAARATSPLRVLLNGRRSRPKKGTDLILRALAGLRSAPDFEVVLFDSPGPRDPDPREGAPTVRGMRWVLNPSQAELVELYRSAHVFVAAERKAGWCNTALEAMSCGCAVACTRSGTTDFARDGESACMIRFRHPFFIRRAVRELLVDAELRERLGRAGPAAAAEWAWSQLASRILAQL